MNYSIARVEQYSAKQIGKAERHNERKNEVYSNMNVETFRSDMNFHFADCGEQTYLERLKEMEEQGLVSKRGLREDAKIFDEMIIDVNSRYFEEHGGYDYAVRFYREAFNFCKIVYGKQNILSAVMHADELNIALTEELGHPVYHYHMHVIAMPVVDKEILWSKRCKDEALRGTVKETIHQISHSKKWASKTLERDAEGNVVLNSKGLPKFVKSYSLLQDDFYGHMKEAGFKDFERGREGSQTKHLTSVEYEVQLEKDRLEDIEKEIDQQLSIYDTILEDNKEIEGFEDLEIKEKTLSGKVSITKETYQKLKSLAEEGLRSRTVIAKLKNTVDYLTSKVEYLNETVKEIREKLKVFTDQFEVFIQGVERFPNFMKQLVQQIRDELEHPRKTKEEQYRRQQDGLIEELFTQEPEEVKERRERYAQDAEIKRNKSRNNRDER